MDEDGFFGQNSVTVIGLGLMGGSLALALKDHCNRLVGYDPDPAVLKEAEASGVFQLLSDDRRIALQDTGCIILTAPVSAILEWLAWLPKNFSDSVVLIDMGSTKSKIVDVMDHLPEQFETVGGHPMCGKEKSGFANAESSLFTGATFALVQTKRSTRRAICAAEELARIIQAEPLWLDAQTHDLWTAYTSHFPYLVSNILAATTPEPVAPMIGPGFRSTTRLAGSSIKMMIDIIESNRENVRAALKEYSDRLAELDMAFEESDHRKLEEILYRGYCQHQSFQTKK